MNVSERRDRALYLNQHLGWPIKRIAHELGTSDRTIKRDLAAMRVVTGAPTSAAAYVARAAVRPARRRRVRAEQGEGLFS